MSAILVASRLAASRSSRIRRRVVHLSPPRGGQSHLRRGFARGASQTFVDAWATDLVGASEVVMRRAWGEEWRLDPRCRLIYPGVAIEPFGVAIAARRRALDIGQDADPNVVTVVHVGEG
nr:hypothetical protein [Micromonospora sp. DSM 115978]